MLQELEDLSNALDNISEGEAKDLVTHVNRRLRNVLNADIIDVMYREEARGNDIILRPLSSVVSPGGRDEAAPWPINKNSPGVWPKVFFNGATVWLEDIKQSRDENESITNVITGNAVTAFSPEELSEIYHNTDSMLCIPLVIDHTPVGIFCVELAESDIFNKKTIKFLKRLAGSYACLTWQVSALRISKKHTIRAIDHFKVSATENRIREYVSYSSRGVLLRPFGEELNVISSLVSQAFENSGLELRHFIASPGVYVMDELITEIKLSPFGVVNITGLNSNVLIEFGMMKVLEKDIMILRNSKDTRELPFDIKADQVEHYELRGNEAHIIETGTGRLVPLRERVAYFVQCLKNKGLVS